MACISPNGAPLVEVLSCNIEKPDLDDRAYRFIKLRQNNLQVLLVQDPKTEKSSAAMDVHVGSASDPPDFQGLAHALEHCLFLGIPTLRIVQTNLSCRHDEVSRRK